LSELVQLTQACHVRGEYMRLHLEERVLANVFYSSFSHF